MIRGDLVWGGLVIFLIAMSSIAARGQAVIEGTVALPKAEPALVPPPRYAGQVGEIAPPDPPTAVVYLEGRFPASATNTPPGTNSVLQQGMQFRPALLPVRTGTTVEFPNGDDFYHNVFSYSKPKRFDLGRYRKEDRPAMEVFDKPGVVKLFCEIHKHMRGVILVLNTPYFTRTTPEGTYRLTNLPPGKYMLKVWISETQTYDEPVELSAGKTLHIDFGPKAVPKP
jgi:plastocyanin